MIATLGIRRRLRAVGALVAAGAVSALCLAGAPLSAQRAEVAPVPPAVRAILTDSLVVDRATIRFESVDSVLARAVAGRIRTQPALPALADTIPWGAEIFLPRSETAIDLLLEGRRPEWSAGLARPADGWIILPAGRGEPTGRRDLIDDVLRHEWAHIGLHQAVGGYRGPRWFVEGYAQWASGWDTESAWRLRIALATNDSLSLSGLTLRWPGGRSDAEMAYLVSATVVDYLVEQSGERGLQIFIERWRDTGRFEEALRLTYGLTSARLEEDWAAWAKDRYGWLYVLTRSGVGWGLLAALLIALVWARRRYRKDQMAELRAREIPDAPDWWSGAGGTGAGGTAGDGTRGDGTADAGVGGGGVGPGGAARGDHATPTLGTSLRVEYAGEAARGDHADSEGEER